MEKTPSRLRMLDKLHKEVDPKCSLYEEGVCPTERVVYVPDADGVVHEIVAPLSKNETKTGWARLLDWLR